MTEEKWAKGSLSLKFLQFLLSLILEESNTDNAHEDNSGSGPLIPGDVNIHDNNINK
eukprot:CAMPEP_0115038812 /NCGR_PEP_ID=MMETSP0216-20121206/43637_1 /TAXON_ID=223996 /ORGANISM="Protocruzia adherens, Strain Boccale" /LENGTH=56 /DNA_ID=CAMNT_0002419295 /DNA_START=19 /DNA_END=186 /DNA_ORIENTATION=+